MAGYKTPQLYDEGEEDWPLKVHVSCGDIYLEGYTNIDSVGMHPYESLGLVEANKTTIDDYWKNKIGKDLTAPEIPTRDKIALDVLADPRTLPYGNQVDKIIAIHCFEHFTLTDANRALLNWWNAMKPNGILILSVPDPIGMAQLLQFDALAVRQWAIKNLMGDNFNAYSLHHWAYTEQNLRDLLTRNGFTRVEKLTSIHFYPSIMLKARKGDLRTGMGREYQQLPDFSRYKMILDVGPGQFPLPEATHFLDLERPMSLPDGANLTILNLNERKLPWDTNLFDFVYCSHVLEHLDRPAEVLAELVRVGKSGYIEVPSVVLDFLMRYGGTHTKWACWKLADRKLLFVEKSKEYNQLFTDWDRTWGSFFHNAVHGAVLSAVQLAIRAFFWQNVGLLNIGASWNKSQSVKIVEMRG